MVATTLAAVSGAPAAVIGASIVAPAACAYDVFLGKGAFLASAMNKQLDRLKQSNDERADQLEEAGDQLKELTGQNAQLRGEVKRLSQEVIKLGDLTNTLQAQNEQRRQQIVDQEEQIKKLAEIHVQLRLALQGLAVAGDTFDGFGQVLSEHVATLSEKIDHLSVTSEKLDATASVLTHLTTTLDRKIATDRSLCTARTLLFPENQ